MNLKLLKFQWLFIVITALMVISCSDDENDVNLTGTSWQLVSMKINGEAAALTSDQEGELLYFGANNVGYVVIPSENMNIRTAWNYDADHRILNISDLLPVTFYVDEFSGNNLVLRNYAYANGGKLDTYVKTYKKVETKIVDNKLQLK